MERTIETQVKAEMTRERWKHSLGVAETAADLAVFFHCSVEKARIAGILHDYARELPGSKLIRLAEHFGYPVLPEERVNPVVLHAPVGAFLVQEDFGVSDVEILGAITKHTVGGREMTLLDKIIFLADMIEPGRNWPGVEKLRNLVYNDINQAMLEAIDGTVRYLKERNQMIHPLTLLTRKQVLSEIGSGPETTNK